LKSGEDEDRGLSKTGLGLANHVRPDDGLWNASLLNCLVVVGQF
jgi:hypothetical protein